MTLRFTKKHLVTLLFLSIVLICVSYLTYFLLVKPIESEIESVQSNIVMQEKFIDVLQEKQVDEKPPVISSTEIQKKVPVLPLVEQVILEVQEAEIVSNSKISNMSFSESDFSMPAEQVEMSEVSNLEATSTSTEEQPKPFDPSIVEGLKKVTVTLTIESPGYKELEKFLSMLEHQTRITKIDSLNFTGKPEITSVAQDEVDSPLIYAVTLSTFYMSSYPELAVDAPKINVPTPSNKKNPLFVNASDEDDN